LLSKREGATSKVNRESEDLSGKMKRTSRLRDALLFVEKSGNPRINIYWFGDFLFYRQGKMVKK